MTVSISFDILFFEKIKENTQIMKQLFFYLSCILFFVSCKNNEIRPSASPDTEIIKKVN